MSHRSQKFIDGMARWLWPTLKFIFRIDVTGQENLPSGKALIVANHNSGALIESHSLVFLCNERNIPTLGLNHRALFQIPLVGKYFQKIGAIPATRDATLEAFKNNFPVLIFPGGNREAFRPLYDRYLLEMNLRSNRQPLP
ncbi:MAG: 1-acyl-sn-glycerol-3-phosphate acyltransferase [Bdellovibrionaceae bacterium]|nr:1-acyl-sn-glycerol-3-phosphate acyltransferase [Pseudobdellovibrionaceae bacterium]